MKKISPKYLLICRLQVHYRITGSRGNSIQIRSLGCDIFKAKYNNLRFVCIKKCNTFRLRAADILDPANETSYTVNIENIITRAQSISM